jgi:hypothetical protein
MLGRVERNAVVACVALAAAACVIGKGRLDVPLGVFAGGALVAISYYGIKSGVTAFTGAGDDAAGGKGRTVARLVKFFTRYAILAVAAYVIMARLGLPPLAVFAGASSLVVAVMLEALRPVRRNPPRNAD